MRHQNYLLLMSIHNTPMDTNPPTCNGSQPQHPHLVLAEPSPRSGAHKTNTAPIYPLFPSRVHMTRHGGHESHPRRRGRDRPADASRSARATVHSRGHRRAPSHERRPAGRPGAFMAAGVGVRRGLARQSSASQGEGTGEQCRDDGER